jgi:hypothetical protein
MEESPPGAKGGGEVPLRAGGLKLMSLSPAAESSLGGINGETSEVLVEAKKEKADA